MRYLVATYIFGVIVAFIMSLILTKRYGYRIVFQTILICLLMALMSWFGIMLMLHEYNER